jgi:pimeloyl-ACP methyl ester carboxylesterase
MCRQEHHRKRLPAVSRPPVMALHCSGSTGRQWEGLVDLLGDGSRVLTPDLIGTAARGHWGGERAFSLADEAAPILREIDALARPVHLVGHSYGGGLALRLAAERPERVASLTLYEPSAFHLLKGMGEEGLHALDEIRAVVADVDRGVLTGAYESAASRFVDYWNGLGAFAAMLPRLKADLIRYIPKACLDFRALIEEATPWSVFRGFGFPVLVMRGEHAPQPTRLVGDRLFGAARNGSLRIVRGAGHMGPITHREVVNRTVAAFLCRTEMDATDTASKRCATVPIAA